MKIILSQADMKACSEGGRRDGKKIAFVPTMGSLHEGHLALFREGKKRGDLLVVSIFVNPTQFNDPKDYERYPRNLTEDLKKCEREGVDIVFAPSADEIYPKGEQFPEIPLPEVAKPLEGISRPGHFRGVVQVVSRLFRIVQPNVALFGLKDYQQLRVIEEMVLSEKIPVKIVPCPTVRTPEGLAMSSRNALLSPTGLKEALLLSQSLKTAEGLLAQGERDARRIEDRIRYELCQSSALQIDYVAVVDARTLAEISVIEKPALVAIAAFIDGVRLIDNCLLPQRSLT